MFESETTVCSFETCSPYVGQNCSSWDSARTDRGFVKEIAELEQ